MKFYATFKTPDAAGHEGFLEQAERELIRRVGIVDDHIDPENEELVDEYNEIAHQMADFAAKWVRNGEYVTLEFDLDAGTCTVVGDSERAVRVRR